jgi:hypothetical protein
LAPKRHGSMVLAAATALIPRNFLRVIAISVTPFTEMYDTDGAIINTAFQSGHNNRLLNQPHREETLFHCDHDRPRTRSRNFRMRLIIDSQPAPELYFLVCYEKTIDCRAVNHKFLTGNYYLIRKNDYCQGHIVI